MTQINLLNDEINELIRERNEMDVSLQNTTGPDAYREIQISIEGVDAQIREKQSLIAELEKQEKIEEKVNADVPFTISGVDLDPIPPEFIAIIKDIVIADRRLRLGEHAIELEQVEAEAKSKNDKMREATDAEVAAIQAQIDTVTTELAVAKKELTTVSEFRDEVYNQNGELRERVFQLNLENADLSSKLNNAVTQIEEKDKEIARLNDQIDDYQKAKVYGERQAQSIIDVSPNEAEEINGKIKKLFTKVEDWGSVLKAIKSDGTFEMVKRDELKEEWAPEVPAYQGGSESTGSFPGEAVETDVADGGLSYPQAPSLDFRPEEESIGGMEGNSDIPEVVGETFEQRTERRLAELERVVYGKPAKEVA
jgi:chromosome segregation ATPase